ncbi:ABC transporter permease [Salibacterium aidingense]|uniref:ABC transporter permease n=1 Tax=Salibacterium aidingense TaxID=384933 RepID=UPI0004198004|nr:ABC transporter permease [Salibacterium aidingense]
MGINKAIALTVKVISYLAVLVFFIWAFANNMFYRITEQPDQFFDLLSQHLTLVGVSAGLAILTSVPLGIIVTRKSLRKSEWLAVNVANLGQTIPSIAVLAIAMGFLGIGLQAAIVALYIYSLLPILQNTIAGIDSVNRGVIDSARGMGFTPAQILFKIELPNAAASILAGIRTAIIINIGTAALAYLIGGGGFGVWIFTGIQLFDNTYLLSGAIPVTLLAVLVDFLFRALQRILVPKGLQLAQEASRQN